MNAQLDGALTASADLAPAQPEGDRFLTVAEAAAVLNVCERTIYDALRANRLRGRRFGRLWRTKREWLDEFGLPVAGGKGGR